MRILIIEDEDGLRNGIKTILENNGYNVDTANNGDTGLEYAMCNIYDLIILDIMMPILDGYAVLKLLRQNKINTTTLYLSAKSELDDKLYGFDMGADDYLTKPFDAKELLARVKALTRRNIDIIDTNLIFHDLTLNTSTKELYSNNKNIKLGAKEFQLLEYLMINKNIVLSKEQLYDKVWGIDDESEYNNVEVYVSFIRKKLLFLKSNVQIKAIRNLGYRMEIK